MERRTMGFSFKWNKEEGILQIGGITYDKCETTEDVAECIKDYLKELDL